MAKSVYDVVIIGHGVSGLTLGSILSPKIQALIIEAGKPETKRDHNDAYDAMAGCGGAGLYSDGKFSFYPSGTEVWNLEKENLSKAYHQLCIDLDPYIKSDLKNFFPKQNVDSQCIVDGEWKFKPYPCYYIDLPDRLELIHTLKKRTIVPVIYHQLVEKIEKNDGFYTLSIKDKISGLVTNYKSKFVVMAGGRFMPLYFDLVPKVFRRIEYGARIEADSDTPDMKQDGKTDPKYLYETSDFQSRTFCWCKEGEVVGTNNGQGIETYSGRADNTEKKSDHRTNFGLNIRIKNSQNASSKITDLQKILPFNIGIDEVTDNTFQKIMGLEYGGYFSKALDQLLKKFPTIKKGNCKIIGPTIEGVGDYPDIDPQSLQIKNENIFCIGDATGIFRGIVASMLSGYFVAIQLNKIFDSGKNVLVDSPAK